MIIHRNKMKRKLIFFFFFISLIQLCECHYYIKLFSSQLHEMYKVEEEEYNLSAKREFYA